MSTCNLSTKDAAWRANYTYRLELLVNDIKGWGDLLRPEVVVEAP